MDICSCCDQDVSSGLEPLCKVNFIFLIALESLHIAQASLEFVTLMSLPFKQ